MEDDQQEADASKLPTKSNRTPLAKAGGFLRAVKDGEKKINNTTMGRKKRSLSRSVVPDIALSESNQRTMGHGFGSSECLSNSGLCSPEAEEDGDTCSIKPSVSLETMSLGNALGMRAEKTNSSPSLVVLGKTTSSSGKTRSMTVSKSVSAIAASATNWSVKYRRTNSTNSNGTGTAAGASGGANSSPQGGKSGNRRASHSPHERLSSRVMDLTAKLRTDSVTSHHHHQPKSWLPEEQCWRPAVTKDFSECLPLSNAVLFRDLQQESIAESEHDERTPTKDSLVNAE
eukprot:scpid75322/ scgid33673/ 